MKIVVLSGKGGTGKSCVASAIALELGHCILVDADVDCPNQFLLFKGKEKSRDTFSASKLAVIGNNAPVCRDYSKVCEFGAITLEGGKLRIIETRCEGCGACGIAFPELEIKLVPKNSGEIMVSETAGFPLVYGRLIPGEAGSGKVVFEIKRITQEIVSRRGIPDILIDAPAGIGCPVIAAVSGSDHAIGIVEPTPASIANLERALEVVRHFSIPYSIVMNKQGISEKYEKEIIQRFGGLLAARIPYDENVPRMLASGTPPSLGKGPAARELKKMAKKLIRLIRQKETQD
ncbi:ATP-binding protein [Candidatus Micrarchaeota archaeon]|nr:ATP-binding protein [Candidatus Micrarchaeota archaeon]